MTIYKALVCPCIFESAYVTISLHRSKEGAEKAIILDQVGRYNEYKECMKYLEEKPKSFERWLVMEKGYRDWAVEEAELLD
jgi:hypothetical protein